MSWRLDGRPLRRVLVTRLRYLGDIAMATVVLQALRRGDPALELGFLCEAGHAPLLAGHPLLARLHALGSRRRGRDAAQRAAQHAEAPGIAAHGTVGTARDLRRGRYDLAVDLFFNPRSAWLLRLAGIPARIGGTTSRSRGRLYTHTALAPGVDQRPDLYAVAGGGLGEHLSRLAPLRHADGRPFLDWLVQEIPPGGLAPRVPRPGPVGPARVALADLGIRERPFTLLAPAATWPTKEWPATHWLALARDLRERGRPLVVLCPPGGPREYAVLGPDTAATGGGLLPPLDLATALAIVGAAAEVVSVDGGIMHAAVAMQVPTVALFGPTDPRSWFPYEGLGPYRVLATRPACHPCHRHRCDAFVCLPELTPAAVARSLAGLRADGDGGQERP